MISPSPKRILSPSVQSPALILLVLSFLTAVPTCTMAFSANAAVRRIARPAAFLHYSTRTTAATRPFTTSPPSSVVDGLSTALFGAETEVDPGKVAGTDLRIVKYPHPSLRRHNQEYTVEELKDKETQKEVARLAKEMFLIMYAAQGVGLAAPQVGVNKRLLVYNQSGDPKKWLDEVVLINPHIVETSQAKTIETEGCLSFPEMDGLVERSKWIKVEALNLKGKKIKKKFVDWEARIFQHEYDHLDGKVYVDRLTTAEELAKVQPRLDELIEEYKADDALTEEPAL